MYCVKCGVELSDTEKKCPLCGTVAYHPDIKREEVPPMYPKEPVVQEELRPKGVLFILSVLFLIFFSLPLFCDLSMNVSVTWSAYVSSSILLGYILIVLPLWFEHPNPVVFVPIDFAAIGLYLAYLNFHMDKDWFLSLAFPIVVMSGCIITTVTVLLKYIKKGHLYIIGAFFIALGVFTVMTEFFICLTLGTGFKFIWSIYPLTVFFLLGMMLIVIAICKPLKESLRRKFFI